MLATLPEARRIIVHFEIAWAFRGAFFGIATFARGALLLAWWIPLCRI